MTSLRNDPVLAYNFLVSFVDSTEGLATSTITGIQQTALGGFSEVSGLELTFEVEEYKEGGRNNTVRKFPTRAQWTNLNLKRGIAFSDDLWQWHYDFIEGHGSRRDGAIMLLNELGSPVRVWHFRRGLPVKWRGPSMNAARAEVAIEEVEIAHEGLELVSAKTLISAGELLSAAGDVGRTVVGGVFDTSE